MSLLTQNKGAMPLLMFNIFLAFSGIGLVIPIMPTYMHELGITGSTVGLLVATFAFTQFIASPYTGAWSDQYGRKRMIVIGMSIFSVSELIFGLANGMELLFFARVLGGVSAACITPSIMAYVADITTEHDRGKGMGWIGAAISTGFIIGPGVGGILADYGIRTPFFVAAAAAGVAAIFSVLFLPESLNQEKQMLARSKPKVKQSQLQDLLLSFRTPYFLGLLIILITSLGLSQFETVLGLYMDEVFGYTPKQIAMVIVIGASVGAFMQLTLFGALVNRIGEKRLISYSLFLATVFIVMTLFSKQYWMVILSTSVFFLAIDFVRPAVTTMFSKVADNEQGFVAGLNSSYTSMGNILGPSFAGFLYDVHKTWPFIIGGVILFIGLLVSVYWKRLGERVTVDAK